MYRRRWSGNEEMCNGGADIEAISGEVSKIALQMLRVHKGWRAGDYEQWIPRALRARPAAASAERDEFKIDEAM